MAAGLVAAALAGCASPDAIDQAGDNFDVALEGVDGHTIPAPQSGDLPPFEVAVEEARIVERQVDSTPADGSPNGETRGDDGSGLVCRSFAFTGPTFASNEATLSDAGREVLDRLLSALADSPCAAADGGRCQVGDVSVIVIGHSDDQPTSRAGGNLQLSLDRARTVADAFVAASYGSVVIEGRADTDPAVILGLDRRSDEEIRALNRRVEIDLVTC